MSIEINDLENEDLIQDLDDSELEILVGGASVNSNPLSELVPGEIRLGLSSGTLKIGLHLQQ